MNVIELIANNDYIRNMNDFVKPFDKCQFKWNICKSNEANVVDNCMH